MASEMNEKELIDTSRDAFEAFYKDRLDSHPDFQIGREYEDDRVYAAWTAWRHVVALFTGMKLVPASPDYRAVAERLAEDLRYVRQIICAGAETGFNCHSGDWAERLFISNARTSDTLAAYEKGKDNEAE